MRRFLLVAVLAILLLSVLVFAGHTRPSGGMPVHNCTCSTVAEPCFDDDTEALLPLCNN